MELKTDLDTHSTGDFVRNALLPGVTSELFKFERHVDVRHSLRSTILTILDNLLQFVLNTPYKSVQGWQLYFG